MLTWYTRADAFVQRVEVVPDDVASDITDRGHRVHATAGRANVKEPALTISVVALSTRSRGWRAIAAPRHHAFAAVVAFAVKLSCNVEMHALITNKWPK